MSFRLQWQPVNFSGRVDPTVAASVHQYHPTMRMASEFVQKRDAHVEHMFVFTNGYHLAESSKHA